MFIFLWFGKYSNKHKGEHWWKLTMLASFLKIICDINCGSTGDPKTLTAGPWHGLCYRLVTDYPYFGDIWRTKVLRNIANLLMGLRADIKSTTDNLVLLVCCPFCPCVLFTSIILFGSFPQHMGSLSHPRLHKIVLLRQRKMCWCPFHCYGFSCQIFKQGDFVMNDRKGKVLLTE